MTRRRLALALLAVFALAGAQATWLGAAEEEEGRKGTVVGTLAAKGDNFIEVKADGEERARRYTPQWVGGLPKDGGGFDKEMVKTIRELKVGSRVRLEWKFEERPRVLKVEVLKAPETK